MEARAVRGADGYFKQIREYSKKQQTRARIMAAWQMGRGRVVAAGTWKLCTLQYGENDVLLSNCLGWLSRRRE
jgi:hypothetical protein